MATPDFMKRIAFMNGLILHDFHLNIMQKNIAEAIKEKVTKERYDLLIMTSNYNQYFAETFINDRYRDPRSTAPLDTLTFTIYEGRWMSKLIEMPVTTNEFYLYANYEDYPNDGARVKFYYRKNDEDLTPWTEIQCDTPIHVPGGTKYIQLMIECNYAGTVRPTVYDYAIMIKDSTLAT